MSKRQKVAFDLDPELMAIIDRIAARWGETSEHVLTTAVLRFGNEEARNLPRERDDPLAELPPYVETDPLAVEDSRGKHWKRILNQPRRISRPAALSTMGTSCAR